MMSFHNSPLKKNIFLLSLAIMPSIALAHFSQSDICQHIGSKKPLFCRDSFQEDRDNLTTLFRNTQKSTNAPLNLVNDTQNLWLKRIYSCKEKTCITHEISLRTDELNTYASLNQSLTQHFFQYSHGKIISPNHYLQIHQLDQKRVKIEGFAYSSKHHHKGQPYLTAYATNTANQIVFKNTEDQCIYSIKIYKALLTLSSEQPECHQYSGIYRLYD
ncbi:A1S_1983 family putative colistin resistance protein [Acinetobacter nectaris]|uniref:A1S_1983 family putative colistin resistance protein n=1 Tax=Acinetobacter nectaris TaxID=1219382 RepID=UPI001F42C138|nr:hypothetical protein [Acinetobacter nectaris]MCF9034460.1 hypothetical protein [Acinetobacter nectaris]